MQEISDLIEVLFEETGSEDLGDIIANAIKSHLFTPEQGARILNISRWGGQTNGDQLSLTLESWLKDGEDIVKIKLALAQDIFLFTSKEEMKNSLLKILGTFPQLESEIKEKIKKRELLGW